MNIIIILEEMYQINVITINKLVIRCYFDFIIVDPNLMPSP